jgi:cbb3-type cytochrome oxidase subunit 3
MKWDAVIYLGMTMGLFAIFAAIVFTTYRKKNRGQAEAPKYRMLDED